MESPAAFKRLEQTVHRLAVAIGAAAALAVPVSFGLEAYFDQLEMQQFRARLAAERLANYAYIHGPAWRFGSHTIPELMAFVAVNVELRQVVVDAQGTEVVSVGATPASPALRVSAPIISGAEKVGTLIIESSLRPFVWMLAFTAMIGSGIGLAVYFAVDYFPLRALRKTITVLAATQIDLSSQISRTQAALEVSQQERERAEAANQAKSEFLANMSHELRTPLTAIIGFGEVVQNQVFGAHAAMRYAGYAADIVKSGLHLLNLINDILDMSKIEAGHHILACEKLSIVELSGDCLTMLRDRAAEKSVALIGDLDAALPSIHGDPRALKQVLLNLLSNAIKFTPAGGSVTLRTVSDTDGGIRIHVTDTGIGIPKDQLTRVFEPFHQVDSTYSRIHKGTGLGLSISCRLVELHGGTLELDSVEGQGTTVLVRLPLVSSNYDPSTTVGSKGDLRVNRSG